MIDETIESMVYSRQYPDPPFIVCLCGSTRFREHFIEVTRAESLDGKIVIGPGLFGHDGDLPPEACKKGHPTKDMLDRLHLRKIDLASEVLVLNVGGYIGESTAREIEYAKTHGKILRYLEPLPGLEHCHTCGFVYSNSDPEDLRQNPHCVSCGNRVFYP